MRQIGVYIAVLNQGNIRPELAIILNQLVYQSKYRIELHYPSEKPISYNRNKIVQDFLAKSEMDYLMMIDSDIVPPANVLNLVDFHKDVVAPLMFAYQEETIIPLTLKQMSDGLYTVYQFNGNEGLMEVDSTGSGCMIIKREVLEKVKHPFENIYDADGMKMKGLDLRFCERAKELGYKIYVHLDYACSHWTTMDLKKIYASLHALSSAVKDKLVNNEISIKQE